MASILKRAGLALALVILIVASSTFDTISVVDARIPYNHARQLAGDCDVQDPFQHEMPGCGGGGGSGGSSGRRVPSGPTSGSSLCQNGCCGNNKMGECICCD